MSSKSSSGSGQYDRCSVYVENIKSSEETAEEESRYLLEPLTDSGTQLEPKSSSSQSDDADSTATVFRLHEKKCQNPEENLKPAFKIGGVLSSRNGLNLEENSHYLFASKKSKLLKGDHRSYENIDTTIPPINLMDCRPHSELSEAMPSPTANSVSSLTSNRKLEWDSGADVGYVKKYEHAASLSTLERIALGNSASFLSLSNEKPTKLVQEIQETYQSSYRNRQPYTETDDTYCDSSDGKSIIQRRVQMRQRFSKNHKVSPARRKPKSFDRGRGKAKPTCMTCEESSRHPKTGRHFGGCCHFNKDAKNTSSQSYLHSTPLCSSVSSGASETLKAGAYEVATGNLRLPSFDTSTLSSLSQLSYDKLGRPVRNDENSNARSHFSTSDKSLSKSSSREATLNETLSAINSSLKDLSVKLKIQADYIASKNYDFSNNKYKQICQWIEFIGMPAVNGSDINFKQNLAEKVINALTKITQKDDISLTFRGLHDEVSTASVVLKDIGHLSKKLGHKNKDSFYEDIKERCTTPGGTVICVPYRPPAATKTYYITVNEELLFLQENETLLSPSKSPNPTVPSNPDEQYGKDGEECLMMVRRISAENIFDESNVEISSDQSIHLNEDSTRDHSPEMSDISRPDINLFRSDSPCSESGSTQNHQGLQETIASSFEFYSASSTDTNLPTLEERTTMGFNQDVVKGSVKETKEDSPNQVSLYQDKEIDAVKKETSREKKKRQKYEKNVLKCIKALERIEKKLQWSNHPSFSDSSSIRKEDINIGKDKFYPSENSSGTCCTSTSYQTTDTEGSVIIHRSPEAKSFSRDEIPEAATVTDSVRPDPTLNMVKASEISDLKKLLASTRLPGEARAHRFLLKDANPPVGNYATAVGADSCSDKVNLTSSVSVGKELDRNPISTPAETNLGTIDNSSFGSVQSGGVSSMRETCDRPKSNSRHPSTLSSDKSSNASIEKSLSPILSLEDSSDRLQSREIDLSNSTSQNPFREIDGTKSKIPCSDDDLVHSREKESNLASASSELYVIEENLKNLRLRCNKFTTVHSIKPQSFSTKIYNTEVKESNVLHAKKTGFLPPKGKSATIANRKTVQDKFKMAQDLLEMNKENGVSLKEALYFAKPSYVIAAERRRGKILRKTKLRQETQAHNHSVLARLPKTLKTPSTLQGFLVKNEESPLFEYKAMREQNKRLVRLLYETDQKETATKKDSHAVTNRLMGQLYSRKLRKKVLCGKVSHGHKLVVSPTS